MPDRRNSGGYVGQGKRRANQLCNFCGKREGEAFGPDNPGECVTLLIDLEEYTEADRVWQAPRGPENPMPVFQVWCTACARQMVHAGDPIERFREFGYPDNSPDGPYAKYLAIHGTVLKWPNK
jgi:hypothetical protein